MRKNRNISFPSGREAIAWISLFAWFFGGCSHYCVAMEDDKRLAEHICLIPEQVIQHRIVAVDVSSSGRNSMLKECSPENLAKRVKEEFNRYTDLLNSAEDKHIVAFLGNTGAGKSTLVNLLAGKELDVEKGKYVLANRDDKEAMAIGGGGDSQTLYPKFIDVGDLRFFDLPGLNDTGGGERNLLNAAFIHRILLQAKSVRFVVVADHGQFTSDKADSAKKMFHRLAQLFKVESGVNLINEGIFIVTKVTCYDEEKNQIARALLTHTDSQDKSELYEQLQSWSQENRLCHNFHAAFPGMAAKNKDLKDEILSLIKNTKSAKVPDINVSVLYPSDTKEPLEEMFLKVIGDEFDSELNKSLTTLSDYDKAIIFYKSARFWKTFDTKVCQDEGVVGLLKPFCETPYNKAFTNFEKDNENKREDHINSLNEKREGRVQTIEKDTKTKVMQVISSLVPRSKSDDSVAFDFAYHKDYYDQVCGPESIKEITNDALEQDVVRSYYAGFISQHCHQQMQDWFKKISGQDWFKKTSGIEKIEEECVNKQSFVAMEDKMRQMETKLTKLETRLTIPQETRHPAVDVPANIITNEETPQRPALKQWPLPRTDNSAPITREEIHMYTTDSKIKQSKGRRGK